jgi:hypothetical protein
MEGNNNIIRRLFSSFSELEQAIESAKSTLLKKESIPDEIMERLNSYDGILEKQRVIASRLCQSIEKEDWDEVNRNVALINGLSSMIRDDARAILSAITLGREDLVDKQTNYC